MMDAQTQSLVAIAERMAAALKTLCQWIEDPDVNDIEISEPECDAAMSDAVQARKDFAAWRAVSAGCADMFRAER